MRSVLLLVALGVLALAQTQTVRYDNHQVWRLHVDPENLLHRDVVRGLHETRVWKIDFWSDHGADIRVPPEISDAVAAFLRRNNVEWDVMIPNIQTLIDQEAAYHEFARSLESAGPYDPFFNDYHNLDDLNAFVVQLVGNHTDIAKIVQVASTYQGRTVNGVVIQGKAPTTAIYIEGGIHAREWVAHASVTFVLYRLLTGYGTDQTITQLVDSIQFHVVPCLNQDGYVYTWTGDRMWRKTMSPNPGSSCFGTDPNRNWDNHWCEQGASRDPCDDAYCGRKAFSEIEVQSIANYVLKVGNIKGFIDFHSYSQLWMQPYGWTAAKPKDYDGQRALGLGAVAAIKKSHGKTYQEGSIYTIIYPASGSSADWAYDQANCTYPYGVELRDTGQYGFLLPANQIVPTGEEVLAAFISMCQYILAH